MPFWCQLVAVVLSLYAHVRLYVASNETHHIEDSKELICHATKLNVSLTYKNDFRRHFDLKMMHIFPPPLQDSEELNEVYRLFGIAAHHCSNIEHRLLMFLFEPMWFKEEMLTEEKIAEVEAKLNGMTLGQIIQQIKKNYALDKDQEEYMQDILTRRNYLMHHFYAFYGIEMHLNSTLIKMQQGSSRKL